MQFSKQDVVTFALGLLVAVAVVLGEAALKLEADPTADLGLWARNLLAAVLVSTCRYLVTRLPDLLRR